LLVKITPLIGRAAAELDHGGSTIAVCEAVAAAPVYSVHIAQLALAAQPTVALSTDCC